MLRLLIILSVLNTAYLSDIVSNGDSVVLFGRDASLSCSLSHASGVKQVTWQRISSDGRVQTLATISERAKDLVDDQYAGKIAFKEASFNSTSIVIKNVTFEDEACYICSFKVYPLGPKRETLCLKVKGVSKITASVHPASSSNTDVIVSCSATGKPTPILQWKSTEKELNLELFNSNNSTALNNDSSSTTTSNITLPLSEFHGKYVECVAQSDSMEDRYQIFVSGGDDEVNDDTSRSYIITISILIIVIIVAITIIITYLYTRLNRVTPYRKSTFAELVPSLSQSECKHGLYCV